MKIVKSDVCSNHVTKITSTTCPVDGTFSNLQACNYCQIKVKTKVKDSFKK